MHRQPAFERLIEIIRFYQAAAINALFGFGLYSFFVWLGLNIYLAQIIAHILGVIFNYFTYSRHVFRQSDPTKFKFIIAYIANYLVGFAALALVSRFIQSPYAAGLAALVLASIVNYFALKHFVFAERRSQ